MIHFLTKRSKRLFHEIYIMISLLCISWEIFSQTLIVGMFCGGFKAFVLGAGCNVLILFIWVLNAVNGLSPSCGCWIQ